MFQGTKQLVIKSPCSSFSGASSDLYPLQAVNALTSPLPLDPSLETLGFGWLPISLKISTYLASASQKAGYYPLSLHFFFPTLAPAAINDFLPTHPVEILTR